jgi:membrane associated rhomboid family serine protease
MSVLDWWTVRIAVICTAVFILQVVFEPLTDQLALVSADVLARPWTLVTSIFAHASFEHLFFNMFGLLLFGTILEGIVGHRRWLLLFFVAGIVGGIATVPLYTASLGASGAIFGLISALAVLRPRMTVYVSWVPMPMSAAVVVWAAGDLLGLFVPTGVANAAHLAGLVIGLLLGWRWRDRFGEIPQPRSRPLRMSESRWRRWEDEYL